MLKKLIGIVVASAERIAIIDGRIGARVRRLFIAFMLVGLVIVLWKVTRGQSIPILQPAGIIARKERNLLLFAAALALIVVIPVFAMTIGIVWKYREKNTAANYQPDWDHDRRAETVWWTVPIILISILAVVTWRSSHDLDPRRPIVSTTKALTIQVVALDWKWLFIYPDYGIATVNSLNIPTDTPISFEITSDAPMNSFWIPQLGGQIYAMSNMTTQLQLMADRPGNFIGSSANISGEGFADMRFMTQAQTTADFMAWVSQTKQNASAQLDFSSYNQLSRPSRGGPYMDYEVTDSGLFHRILMKSMSPSNTYSRPKLLTSTTTYGTHSSDQGDQ